MSKRTTESGTAKQHLQDIALAEGGINRNTNLESDREQRQEQFLNDLEMTEDDTEDRKLRSGSLRRFFRKQSKKTSESTVTDMRGERKPYGEEQNPTDDDEMVDVVAAGCSDENQEKFKRLKFRLGSMYRYSNSQESVPKLDLNDTESKVTLKSSLSNYWNAVFKKKKSKSAHEVGREREAMGGGLVTANNYSESTLRSPQRGNTLAEDIHALKISEDPNGN